MKSLHLKTLLKFLKTHKQINKTNVAMLDKEITEEQIYEVRTYTEGKLSHLSFGHSIKGWTDQNGVIITNGKPVRKKQLQRESDMKSTWTGDQQQYLNDMETRINKKIDDNHKDVKSDIKQLKTQMNKMNKNMNKILEHLKIQ